VTESDHREFSRHWHLDIEPSSNVQARVDTDYGVLEAAQSLSLSVSEYDSETITVDANPDLDGPASASIEISPGEAEQLAETLKVAVANARGERDD